MASDPGKRGETRHGGPSARLQARGVRLGRRQTGAKVEAAIRARLVRGEGIKKVAKAIGVGNGPDPASWRVQTDRGDKETCGPSDVREREPEDVTKPWLIGEAMRAYNAAMRAGQAGAAKNCLELFAKLTGILVERKELRVIRSIEDLTDEELSAIIVSDRSGGGTDECPPQTAASVQ